MPRTRLATSPQAPGRGVGLRMRARARERARPEASPPREVPRQMHGFLVRPSGAVGAGGGVASPFGRSQGVGISRRR